MLIQKKSFKRHLQMIMNKNISKIVQLPLEGGDSLTGKTSLGETPILKLRLFFKDNEVSDVIVKCKSSKVILNGIKLLNYEKSRKLYYALARYHRILSFDGSFIREIAFYNKIKKELRQSLPFVYGTYQNKLKNRYMIVMKEFSKVEIPSKDLVYRVLDSILPFHISFYGKKESVTSLKLNSYSVKDYQKSRPLLRELFEKLGNENVLYFKEDLLYLMNFIDTIHKKREELREHVTLTHNDFCPRNLFFNGENIIIYDWELAAYGNPEHDLIEYLSFVLHEFSDSEVYDIMEYHREKLFLALNINMSKEEYQKILEFNISEFIVNKLSVYRRAGKFFSLDFIENLCINSARLFGLIRRNTVLK